jgi:hypothetical protein
MLIKRAVFLSLGGEGGGVVVSALGWIRDLDPVFSDV